MYFLNPRLAADVFDGEYIIANLDTGLYYSLQGLAVSLVNALPFQDQMEVISLLVEAFPEQEGLLEQELNQIFNELLNEEIILLSNTPGMKSGPVCIAPSVYIPSRFNRYADMQDLLLLDPIHDVDEEGWTVQENKD